MARDGQFVWIGLYEPSEELLREVQREFGLHDLAIEDAHLAHQRPKVELYDERPVRGAAHRAAPDARGRRPAAAGVRRDHVFRAKRYVVTVRHGSMRSHVGVRARCEAKPLLLAKGPAYVLYALLDFVVDQYLPVAEAWAKNPRGPGGARSSRALPTAHDQRPLPAEARAPVAQARHLPAGRDVQPPDPSRSRPDPRGHAALLPRRPRPGDAHQRSDRRPARAAHRGARVAPVAALGVAERRHAAAGGLGGDHRRAHHAGGDLRHELRVHAGAAMELGYPLILGSMGFLCVALFRAFKRSGWL